ncbi:hypothetical protein C1T17_18745 [Sphingobium sp. SCG-1]|uniref:hypothetical protein n=1 Tax=Sphingobium sp. SCG-1 TaxID=2072936 RepID=UPI000CD68B06|nr:hypothetical protein [Sphingobium sp. SCG-1]AUW59813.1 hypothetical protein C1T17_18745 [Sphingobium sp. SCG-1]
MFPTKSVENDRMVDYARKMSSHVAAALVLFAVLQIAVVAKTGGSLLMHFGIFLAIGGFSIAARGLERRWSYLGRQNIGADRLKAQFQADLLPLWSASLVAPFLWIPVAVAGRLLFS